MAGFGCWLVQEQFEELFFDGRLEAADEGDGCGCRLGRRSGVRQAG